MQLADAATPPEPRRPMSRRDMLGELIAVLSLGVFFHLVNALAAMFDGTLRESPVWVGYLMGIATSVQVAVPVAWIMYRSDKPLREFGIVPVRYGRDIGLAIGVCIWTWLSFSLARFVLMLTWNIPGVASVLNSIPATQPLSWDTPPHGVTEISLLICFDLANGFAEELVIRCYLITRLSQLLNSRWRAVTTAAAIMASYHIYNGSYGAFEIFLSEIGVGALWLLTPRLWPFAIGHALYNASLFAVRFA